MGLVDARLAVALLAMGGYTLIARGAGSVYPFSVFPMYSEKSVPFTSRVMVRAGGEFFEVTDYQGWRCEALPTLEATSCGGVGGIPYIDREHEAHIRAHPGAGGEPVALVRRVFSFDGVDRSPCEITRCTASRR